MAGTDVFHWDPYPAGAADQGQLRTAVAHDRFCQRPWRHSHPGRHSGADDRCLSRSRDLDAGGHGRRRTPGPGLSEHMAGRGGLLDRLARPSSAHRYRVFHHRGCQAGNGERLDADARSRMLAFDAPLCLRTTAHREPPASAKGII